MTGIAQFAASVDVLGRNFEVPRYNRGNRIATAGKARAHQTRSTNATTSPIPAAAADPIAHARCGWPVGKMDRTRNRFVAALRNGLIAILSLFVGLAACEVSLRFFHPRYSVAVEDLPEVNTLVAGHQRGARRRARRGKFAFHPDTRVEHRWLHNNLGGRQSRDFPPASLRMTVNVGFFGDSQTENVDIPAQYSYTEPLDFLLNIGDRFAVDGAKPGFNVLNFGRRGYGPARSYLRWLQLPERSKLAHVFYMVCKNDLADLEKALRSNLVRRGASGEMQAGSPLTPPAWKRMLAHLHITYVAVDAWQRTSLVDRLGSGSNRLPGDDRLSHDDLILMFHDIVRRWKSEVEAHGAAFHLVLLPNPIEGFGGAMRNEWLRKLRSDATFATEIGFFDLAKCFQTEIPDFDYRDWRFDNDPHWNSAANMVAATCLYRYLEGPLSLPERTDEDLANARYAYYHAFLDSAAWEGQRYMPDEAWVRPSNTKQAASGEAIVAKYLALELRPQMEGQWLGAVRAAREAGPLATSVWDIYANARERLLVYVKRPCAANWRARGLAVRFFLHGVPFTAEWSGHHVRGGGSPIWITPLWRTSAGRRTSASSSRSCRTIR